MPALPVLEHREVVQVVMTDAFYNAHFKPLLEREDFLLFRMPGGDPDDLVTYGIALGDRRAGLFNNKENK